MYRLLLYFGLLVLISCSQKGINYRASFYIDSEAFGVVDSICVRTHSVKIVNKTDTLIGEGMILKKTKYDINGKKISEQHLNGIAPDKYSTFHYDDQDRLQVENVYNDERKNERIEFWSYAYDIKGNLVNEIYHYEKTNWAQTVEYRLDAKNRILHRTVYNSNGTSKSKEEIKLDDNGNWVESRKFSGKDVRDLIEAEYNAMNMLIRRVAYLTNNQTRISEYKYDRYGNTTSYKFTSTEGDKSDRFEYTYVYEFDAKGNWIKKTTFEDGICSSIVTREIFYYEI